MLFLVPAITTLSLLTQAVTVSANPDSSGPDALEHHQPEVRANPWYIGQSCRNSQQGNLHGTCQYTWTCKSRHGTADTGNDCPGPDDVQCCIFDDCVNGAKGTCADTGDWQCRCGGKFNHGDYCPGPDNYLCCQGTLIKHGQPCPI